jgi:hypothetical protein
LGIGRWVAYTIFEGFIPEIPTDDSDVGEERGTKFSDFIQFDWVGLFPVEPVYSTVAVTLRLVDLTGSSVARAASQVDLAESPT